MQEFYNKMGIIIGFLFLMFLLQTFAGDKTASSMVLLILFTMIMINAETFTNYLGDKFTTKKEA
jgi:dipeptide/tripeptide permease